MSKPFDVRVKVIHPPGLGGIGGQSEVVTLPKITVEIEAVKPVREPSFQTQKSLVKRDGATAYTLGALLSALPKERLEEMALALAIEAIAPEVAVARLGTAEGGSRLG